MPPTDEPTAGAADPLDYDESELRLLAMAIVVLEKTSEVFKTRFTHGSEDSHAMLCMGLSGLLDETMASHTLAGQRTELLEHAYKRLDEWSEKPA